MYEVLAMPASVPPPGPLPLQGLRVVCFESRRSAESSRMIARQGGEPVEAPALREVPLRGPLGLDALEQQLLGGGRLTLVLLTGVGTDLMIEGIAQSLGRERALQLLGAPSTTLVCRGPKPHAVLKASAIKPAVVVGEPNTWRDVLRELDAADLVQGRAVYVQEYGRSNVELLAELAQRAPAELRQIKTYEWTLPADLGPLEAGIERIARGDAEVALFTSGVQVTHLLQVAERLEALERLQAGLERVVIASVGPLTSETLKSAGLRPDVEPAHPKLGHLMQALAAEAAEKLAQKRAARDV
jgi:uroporphyrinogen-III synthase